MAEYVNVLKTIFQSMVDQPAGAEPVDKEGPLYFQLPSEATPTPISTRFSISPLSAPCIHSLSTGLTSYPFKDGPTRMIGRIEGTTS